MEILCKLYSKSFIRILQPMTKTIISDHGKWMKIQKRSLLDIYVMASDSFNNKIHNNNNNNNNNNNHKKKRKNLRRSVTIQN